VQKEHNISLKHYKTTWLDTFSSFPSPIYHYLSIQTVTTLDLAWNQIGAEGAQHLAQALQNNMVRNVFFFSITYLSLRFNADTHQTRS
jgi:Ran GTPase-activating protein (RanGAP) involved in mRNA processing and transport